MQNRLKSAESRADEAEKQKDELETESGELRERAATLDSELNKVLTSQLLFDFFFSRTVIDTPDLMFSKQISDQGFLSPFARNRLNVLEKWLFWVHNNFR